MIADARRLETGTTHEFDICIVGGGAAGISLALGLESSGKRVAVLESGGFGYDGPTQEQYEGEVSGDPYPPLRDTRMAGLGGSTAVWAGWCRPLDPLDFAARAWAPAGGWPFGLDELLPYYREAHGVLGLGPYDYDAERWALRSGLAPLPLPGGEFPATLFQVSPVHFGTTYRETLERSRTIHVLLHGIALRLNVGASGDVIESASAAAWGGTRVEVRAKTFVLAAGGIENPRLLLLSGDSPERSPGNARGRVGRCFTEHAFLYPGHFVPGRGVDMDFYFPWRGAGMPPSTFVRGGFALSPEVQEREALLNIAVTFRPAYEAHPVFASGGVQAMLELWEKVRGRGIPGGTVTHAKRVLRSPGAAAVALWRRLTIHGRRADRWPLKLLAECETRPENRVVLSSRRDAFDRPLPRVEWRLGDLDVRSMRQACARFESSVKTAGLGRIEWGIRGETDAWRAAVVPAKHHMGTTRMHADPAQGVVDQDCRVHGLHNLYLTGSSVFPTVGYANPTLTVVALARRLAARLRDLS
jgi:choline dehydrogenase-like flavoprotein